MLVVMTCFWLAMVGQVEAQSGGIAGARLLAKSSTGHTVLLNIGEWDQVRTGDHGWILRRIAQPSAPGLRVIPVARGRVVRTGKNRSLWFLYDIQDQTQLLLREQYLVSSEQMALNGRRTLESTRQLLVAEKAELDSELAAKQQGQKDALSLRKKNYAVVKKMHPLGERWQKDGQLHDVAEWVKVNEAGETKYAKALWRSPYEKDFALRKRVETFEKLVTLYLERVNDPAFNYGDFYWQQTRDASGEFRVGSSAQTEYQRFKDEEQLRASQDAHLYRDLLEKGQAWSTDYSDEELKGMMNRVGIIYEQERRRQAITASYDWQLSGNVGLNLLDNENRVDAANDRKIKWALELVGEWFVAPRHEQLQKFSLWSSLRFVQDGVSTGTLNAQSTEYSFAFGGSWHLWRSPFSIEQNIPFFSIGVRTGIVRLATPSNGDEANYDMLSVPTLAAGIKYNFRSGIGLKLSAGLEKLSLSQTESNQVSSILPQKQDILEGRLGLGLTKLY